MSSIRIGNQSAQSARNLWEPFDFAFANGFDAYEWFSDKKVHAGGVSGFDEADLDASARAGIRERAKQANMLLTVHAPWQANPLQLDGSELVLRSIDFARDIGAALVNIHLYMSHGSAGFVSAMRPLLKYARERNIAITIENTVHTTPGEFNEVFELMKTQPEYDAKYCGMCLDIGHANLCSETHNDFIKYMDKLASYVPILHVHAHENFGDADSHLPLFTGPAGKNDTGVRMFLERLRQKNFNGAIILEQWPQPTTLLTDARARLRAMWSVLVPPSPKVPDTVPAAHSSNSTIPAVKARDPKTETKTALKVDRSEPAEKTEKPEKTEKAEKVDKVEKKEKTGKFDKATQETVAAFEQVITSVPVPKRSTARAKPKDATPPKAQAIDLSQVLDPFIRALVENHGKQKSWRGRLQWIRDRFADVAFVPTRGDLATLAIYLRFLATGEAVCEEDGGHFRPNHHANAAEQIEAGLERVTTRDNAWILRRIRPYLPSFAEDYRRAEPLTRIRDIAHRNDIPRELKEEIKKRLQNKLHRCAGPEDLRTSAEILERITAAGANYPQAFVDEFKIFHGELSAFFNATSLDDRLNDLDVFLDGADAATVHAFVERKPGSTLDDALLVLSQASAARTVCQAEGKSPLERARRALADVGLEEFAFVQLSEIYNVLPQAQFGEASGWLMLSQALVAAIENVRLSQIQSDECAAVAAELRAWIRTFDSTDRLHLLRMKASFERALRISSNFADESIALFQPRALELGRAIGVDPRAVQVFVEGDVRGSVVFQLSKIAERGIQALRHALDLPAWEAVVPGESHGTLATASSLSAFAPRSGSFIVALEHADGDEEIPTCVKGIVLGHSLPHLSHLCVRARQARVPMAVTDDRRQFEGVRKLVARQVSLRVSAEAVKVREAGRETVTMSIQNFVPTVPQADVSRAGQVTPVEEATATQIGGKAAQVGHLRALAKESRGLFQVPRGVALPFGSFDQVLQRTPSMAASYMELSRVIASSDGAPQLAAIGEIRGLVASLEVPGEWVEKVRSYFDPETRLAARSSANGEDLENLAGAGLYDSILNVRSETIPDAIRQVWASVWTPRAVRSRAQCGIAHETIKMSVLMQELIDAEYAFIMHTTDTVAKDPAWATVELCAGLGETLASAAEPGAPYRLRCGRKTGEVRVEACASFSCALRSAPQGGTARERLDYSKVGLSADAAAVKHIGLRLAKLAEFLEAQIGAPQDVEGVIRGGILCVVQSRRQQGV